MNQVNPVFMEEKECISSNFLPGSGRGGFRSHRRIGFKLEQKTETGCVLTSPRLQIRVFTDLAQGGR